jgi:hypothetical protein
VWNYLGEMGNTVLKTGNREVGRGKAERPGLEGGRVFRLCILKIFTIPKKENDFLLLQE